MKSTKTFNNISDKLRSEIPKLKKGEKVVFQMLNGVPNPEPDDKERAKQGEILYGKRQIPTTFRIYDPYQKDSEGKEVGGYIEVGCVETWDRDQPVRFRTFIPGLSPGTTSGSFFQGKFSLMGGNIADEELFEILWLSNAREGNPHADAGTEKVFKILDLKAETTKTVSKFEQVKKALDLVKTITVDKARQVLAALNKPTYQDDELVMAAVKELAMSDYDSFLKAHNDPETEKKYQIKTALELGILTHDVATGDVKLGNAKIGVIGVEKMDDLPGAVVKWLESAQNGKDVMANILKQLKEKQEVVK
jgi:hypothetical protein